MIQSTAAQAVNENRISAAEGHKDMQEFSYRMIEDGTYCVTGYRGDEAQVVIPDTFQITVLSDKLFQGHEEIETIQIPDTVTDLGEFLFDGCSRLAHLRLPKQLRNLWGHTFVRSGLVEIEIPSGVTNLPPYVFKDCGQLRQVVCQGSLKKIHPWAFGGCPNLEKLIVAGVEISPQAFLSKEREIQNMR